MRLRLLAVGPPAAWLPPFCGGRLLIGAAPSADFCPPDRAGLFPFHALVELARDRDGFARLHDLARRGDVGLLSGEPAPREGVLLAPGARFRIGRAVLALVEDATRSVPSTAHDTQALARCLVCRGHEIDIAGAHGRRVGADAVCAACLGAIDRDAAACPGYELLATIGTGAFGSVYLGVHLEMGWLVAIKSMRRGLGVVDQARATRAMHRFFREIKILAALDHPHIIRIVDALAAGDETFLISEFARGGDLHGRLERERRLPPREVLRIGLEVADALAYAKDRGIIHRDVKPANVFLVEDGRTKLGDFGLAKSLRARATTGTGVGLGTVAYAAPEQIMDARASGPPADVFGLAATLYHLATGQPSRDRAAVMENGLQIGQLIEPPRPAHEVAPDVPRGLSALLEASLRTEPDARPTIEAVRHELGRLFAGG